MNRSRPMARAELAIAWVLRGGVALSGAVIAVGLTLRIFHLAPVQGGRSEEIIGELLAGKALSLAPVPQSAAELFAALGAGRPDAIMALGLLLLIALPVVRVAMTVVLFLIERDFIYLGITLLVFGVLLSGILFGKAL